MYENPIKFFAQNKNFHFVPREGSEVELSR